MATAVRMGIEALYLVDISFLDFGLWDILDIAIVAFLIYRIYKLIQGSIAFSILAGLFTIYVIWWIVNALHMQLVSNILSQFASVGVILLIVVFQPEIRKFLIQLGQSTFGSRLDPVKRWLKIESVEQAPVTMPMTSELHKTIIDLSAKKRDAVFILNSAEEEDRLKYNGGLELNTPFNKELVESLLLPDSKWKKGAIILNKDRIEAVGAKFAHSEAESLPEGAGMRHRLGLGATENADVGAIIISDIDGGISTAYKGYLAYGISDSELKRFIEAHTS